MSFLPFYCADTVMSARPLHQRISSIWNWSRHPKYQSRENHSLYFFLSENASVRYFPNTTGSVFFISSAALSRFFKSYFGLYRLKKVHWVKKWASFSKSLEGQRLHSLDSRGMFLCLPCSIWSEWEDVRSLDIDFRSPKFEMLRYGSNSNVFLIDL